MCTNEELKEAIENLEKSLIASRDNNHTVSEIMLSFSEKLEKHAEDNRNDFEKLNKKIDPMIKIMNTANNSRKGLIWIAGFLLALGTVIGSIYKIKEWITK